MVRTDDGHCHLLYSRWPRALGFDAWATHAEIAWATAKKPEGPYKFQRTVLESRGGRFWDGHSVYNTCIIPHDGKFYLYYTGNRGTGNWSKDRAPSTKEEAWWTQRNNQRIGVCVARHPGGPWTRFDKPLIDVCPDYGSGIVATPCVTAMPDGRFLMVYKTLAPGPGRVGGGVFHYPATASNPLGPFVRYPKPVVDKSLIFSRHLNFTSTITSSGSRETVSTQLSKTTTLHS
jgi:beta-xylosidase